MPQISKSKLHSLLRACHAGDLKAQKLLYEQFYRNFLHVPLKYSSLREEANGIFNQAMLKLFQNTKKALEVNNLKAYFYTIIKGTTIDHLRKISKHHDRIIPIETDHIDTYTTQVDDLLDPLHVEDLFKIINQLPEMERSVFCLFEVDGYKHKEITSILDISLANSKYLLHQAKKKLRSMVSASSIIKISL